MGIIYTFTSSLVSPPWLECGGYFSVIIALLPGIFIVKCSKKGPFLDCHPFLVVGIVGTRFSNNRFDLSKRRNPLSDRRPDHLAQFAEPLFSWSRFTASQAVFKCRSLQRQPKRQNKPTTSPARLQPQH